MSLYSSDRREKCEEPKIHIELFHSKWSCRFSHTKCVSFWQKFDLPIETMRVVFEGSYCDLKLLDSPNKVLKELGFFKSNKVIPEIYSVIVQSHFIATSDFMCLLWFINCPSVEVFCWCSVCFACFQTLMKNQKFIWFAKEIFQVRLPNDPLLSKNIE